MAQVISEERAVTSTDEYMHSFIIRVWADRPTSVSPAPGWHAQVIHVASGRRLYFQDLEKACDFVTEELAQWGINTSRP